MIPCPNCGKPNHGMIALGAFPRCQHRLDGRRTDPNAQCVFRSQHSGCHKAQYPSEDVWFCKS